MITVESSSLDQTLALGAAIGAVLRGGEVLELASDLGGGKTAFMKGIAKGMGSTEVVQSPTFTISRIYACHNDLELHHFDFYRLQEAGVMSAELFESLHQPNAVVAIEWSDIVHDILPEKRVTIQIKNTGENSRVFTFAVPGGLDHVAQAISAFQETRNLA